MEVKKYAKWCSGGVLRLPSGCKITGQSVHHALGERMHIEILMKSIEILSKTIEILRENH